ncbi:MBOAT family protein, partial [bacterium]|nr:MBOAT family protein [bacterium]
MLFSSLIFLCLFLPLFLAIYFLTGKGQRNQVLLFGSLIFYTWGEGRLVALLLLSLIFNYVLAARVGKLVCDRTEKSTGRAKKLVAFSVIANLIPLVYYKYADFMVGDLADPIFGPGWLEVALPLGISFYTFQAMSYVIDVYRRDASPVRSFTHFACYVTCFPQLIAGPIVRYK